MWRVAIAAVLLAGAAHAETQVIAGAQGFGVENGGFAEAAACTVGEEGWSFYACLSLALGYQHGTVIATDAGELGARFRPGAHVSFTLGAGSSLVTAAVHGLSCVVDRSNDGEASGSCDRAAMPLHAYPGLGVHLHATIADRPIVVSAQARYHLSARERDGIVRAPYGLAVGLGTSLEW